MLKITATIDNNTKVVLNGDGTWDFADGNCEKTKSKDRESVNFFDVRKLNWGMNRSEVIRLEREQNSELLSNDDARKHYKDWDKCKDDCLIFSNSINDKDVHLLCSFVHDKLYEFCIIFLDKHFCSNKYVLDFEWVDRELLNKYGNERSYDKIWFEENRSSCNLGTNISLGYLSLQSKWDCDLLGRTKIIHQLSGGRYVSHRIKFICKDLEGYIRKKVNKKIYDSI